ncbi:HNH endonuclease [Hymenobacter mucosus]|uniref:HNH endonuclease n=1 Tax=Hymenobacter mucosus TaxID=1411120 RepID=A0A238X299_9BACT|nr:HNH endonuclease [Hymenobacter mucosus]SNR53076.1 HNH endonuclease [Hymenobacter mucosus]
MLNPQSPRLASGQLVEEQSYTRAELRQLFDTADTTIETSVFRPSGYDSVWLFITQEASSDPQYQSRLVDTNTLLWSSQLGRHTQLVLTHESRGLELLVFYRESLTQYVDAGFRYIGRFEYQGHTGTSLASLTLARSGSVPSIEQIQVQQDEQGGFNPASVRDGREWVLATIVRRRGQAAFRASLIAAYSSTCPVTGCKVEALLEAAHIIPYLGTTTNHIQNGLPLRTDIHTLFDLQLLAIDPETLTVLLAPSLIGSEYGELAGRSIRLPAQAIHHPSRDALRAHRIRCPF